MTGNFRLLRMLLDVCREHAFRRSACRVSWIPQGGQTRRSLDCLIDHIGTAGRIVLRPLLGSELIAVPISRVEHVGLLGRR